MGKATVCYMLAWWGNMVTASGAVVRREGFTNYSHTLGNVADLGEKGRRGKSSAVQHYNTHAHGRLVAPACIVAITFPKGAPAAMPFLTLKGSDHVTTKNVGSIESLITKYGATVEAVEGTGKLPKALQAILTRTQAKADKAKAEAPKAEAKAPKARGKAKAEAKAEPKANEAEPIARQDLSADAQQRRGLAILANEAAKAMGYSLADREAAKA